jgi:anthranilate phosphoribosyltransferase
MGDQVNPVAQADLRRVVKAVRSLHAADSELRAAVIAARASGETYRDIAGAAGLSHQRVWQIVNPRRH